MTAVSDWDLVDPRNTDAELVYGSMAGDRAAFAQIYDRYADRLHDFCVGMLRDRDSAADCVQDTFCLAATRLPRLREPDRLRPWLYSIARNEALRRLRELRRETPSDELPDIQSEDAGPNMLAARTELADLIAEAAGGLSDRDRAVFDLAFRHGLSGPDLADALGVTHSNANTMVQRLKRTIERSLGALLVARRARSRAGDCAELDEMLELGRAFHRAHAQTHFAPHRVVSPLRRRTTTTGQSRRVARRCTGLHPCAEVAARQGAWRNPTRLPWQWHGKPRGQRVIYRRSRRTTARPQMDAVCCLGARPTGRVCCADVGLAEQPARRGHPGRRQRNSA